MKRLAFLWMLLGMTVCQIQAQNEFAAKAFYNALTDFVQDGKNGFPNNKGPKLPERDGVFTDEYAVKTLLPLADSGKLVWPLASRPYLLFYMTSAADRSTIEQSALHLRETIAATFKTPFYVRTETSLKDKKHIQSNSYLFTEKDQQMPPLADFRIGFYESKGRYFLEFEIRGNHPSE